MKNKNVIIKGVCVGLGIFVVTKVTSLVYAAVIMKLVPNGSEWTPLNGLLTFSIDIVNWICSPFSHILKVFGGHLWGQVQFSIFNLAGWICSSVIFFYFKSKNAEAKSS